MRAHVILRRSAAVSKQSLMIVFCCVICCTRLVADDVHESRGQSTMPAQGSSVPSTTPSMPVPSQVSSPAQLSTGESVHAVPLNTEILSFQQNNFTGREQVKSTTQFLLSMGIFSLAPALILMSTSFVRIVIVLGILRQALGAQQMPPTQVIMALAMFMTFLIMAPVWNEIKHEAIDPYTMADSQMDWETAWERGTRPLKKFMSRQIDNANNGDDIWLFFEHLPPDEQAVVPQSYDDVPLKVLLPAFLISELKVAFMIGVQIYLPFLILDIVISSVTVSMGMMMLPPTMVSLPFKLLLFVLVDGWTLIVGMLLDSFAPYT
jgi:flagellar biosynthetic protein FliP